MVNRHNLVATVRSGHLLVGTLSVALFSWEAKCLVGKRFRELSHGEPCNALERPSRERVEHRSVVDPFPFKATSPSTNAVQLFSG